MSVLSSSAVRIVVGDRVLGESYGRWHSVEIPVVWASVSKLITGAAVRALIEQRVLQVDQPVDEILGLRSASFTIGELIEHRAKLVRVLPEQEKDVAHPYEGWTSQRFDTQVGARFPDLLSDDASYSNLGYAMLARVIEVATQQSLLAAVRELVMTRLDLDGDLLMSADEVSGLAQARSLRGAPLADWNVTGPWVAAAGFATTLTTMTAVLSRGTRSGGIFDPRLSPTPWAGRSPLYGHDGALFRSGSRVLAEVAAGRIAVAHALGGPAGTANVLASSAIKTVKRGIPG